MLRRTRMPRSILGSLFGSATGTGKPEKTSVCRDIIFEHWPTTDTLRAGMRDPVVRALLSADCYVDSRVHWLPYKDEELAKRNLRTVGVPFRLASITVTEPINSGTLLCCVPIELCPSPGFVSQVPILAKCFEKIKTEYSATVGDSTFALDREAICCIALISFGATTEGPLQDYFQAVIDVENVEARWQIMDATSTTGDGDESELQALVKQEEGEVSKSSNKTTNSSSGFLTPYQQQLAETIPQYDHEHFANLLAARRIVIQEFFNDCYGKGAKFEDGCTFEDFNSCVALYQTRSSPVPAKLQDALQCEVGLIPFYDCADHDASKPDMLSLEFFQPAGEKYSQKSAPAFVPMSCRMKPSIGIFANADIKAGEPITRQFGVEFANAADEGNMFWLLNYGSVPFVNRKA